ncbi:hypothetical protein BVRB_5g099840 [Beta vulgaris subsp. vulgaris]|nr:hypothetical protein BVRB_5g099840 [Beta vulgaris subsp. vulgaris]
MVVQAHSTKPTKITSTRSIVRSSKKSNKQGLPCAQNSICGWIL